MKKLLFLLSVVFLFAACTPVPASVGEKVKIESVKKDIVKAIDSTLKDSAAVDTICKKAEQTIEEMPEKGSALYVWFAWIFGFVYFVAGIVASHYPTKKSLWWLRLIPIIVKNFIIPDNKRKV